MFRLTKIMWLLNVRTPNVNDQPTGIGRYDYLPHLQCVFLFIRNLSKGRLGHGGNTFIQKTSHVFTAKCYCVRNGKIDKKMREEIIPEMLKNVSMKNMRFGFEENDEENNDMNPDWEDAFEKSGLGDKLRE